MRNFCLSFFTFFVHQFDFYTKTLTLIPPLSSTLNSPHSHIDSLHSYPYSLFEPSNTETRGTIPKEKGHIDLQIQEGCKQPHQKYIHSKIPIPEKMYFQELPKEKLTPQFHLLQIRFLLLHLKVNSKFANGQETLS